MDAFGGKFVIRQLKSNVFDFCIRICTRDPTGLILTQSCDDSDVHRGSVCASESLRSTPVFFSRATPKAVGIERTAFDFIVGRETNQQRDGRLRPRMRRCPKQKRMMEILPTKATTFRKVPSPLQDARPPTLVELLVPKFRYLCSMGVNALQGPAALALTFLRQSLSW